MTSPTPTTPLWSRRQFQAGLAASLLGAGLGACSGAPQAPDSHFVLLDGSTLRTQDLKGQVALINFWATTCVTCVKEMPALAETYLRFKSRGFATIAVAMSYDRPDWVAHFAATRQLPFAVAIDNTGAIARDWGEVRLTPTTVLVDRQGRMVKRYLGEPDFAALHQLIDQLLAQG